MKPVPAPSPSGTFPALAPKSSVYGNGTSTSGHASGEMGAQPAEVVPIARVTGTLTEVWPGAPTTTVVEYVPVASAPGVTVTVSVIGVVPELGLTESQSADSLAVAVVTAPVLDEIWIPSDCAGPPSAALNESEVGLATSAAGVPPPLFWTVSVPLTTLVPPAVRSTAAVKVCTPSAMVEVLKATAFPFDAVPAKSHGTTFSVLRAVPVAVGLSR